VLTLPEMDLKRTARAHPHQPALETLHADAEPRTLRSMLRWLPVPRDTQPSLPCTRWL